MRRILCVQQHQAVEHQGRISFLGLYSAHDLHSKLQRLTDEPVRLTNQLVTARVLGRTGERALQMLALQVPVLVLAALALLTPLAVLRLGGFPSPPARIILCNAGR